jgi:HK97 family phage major capsid protein
MTSKELREQRAKIAEEIKRLADLENDDEYEWTAEDQENWEKANADYDAFGPQIESAERQERAASLVEDELPKTLQLENRTGREPVGGATPSEEDRAVALQAWCKAQYDVDLTDAEHEAAERCNIRPQSRDLVITLPSDYREVREKRALSVGTATAGGHTVPEGFVNNLEVALLEFGGMRRVAEVIRTDSGNDLPWPTTNDTGNSGALLAENTQVGEQDVAFGQMVLQAFKYTSKLVRVSTELLQDSAFNVGQILGSALGERIGRIHNTDFTTGDGSSKPKGIVAAATVGKTAASATALTADEIIDLEHSVDPAYRVGAGFMLHDSIIKAIRKLKDSDGQYLWQTGLQAGQPDILLRYPVTVNQDMASAMAIDAKTVLFGQLSKYKIRDVREIRLRRLVERYADFDQDGFVAFMRSDGDLLDAGTNPVKVLQQAAA